MNMPDNTNSPMLNSVKETIKSSSIWNKLVKTIENANINMDKLIQDSVSYGIEIGMFHQNKDGSIECKEAKRIANDKFVSPLQQKNIRPEEASQINLRSTAITTKSDSETTLSAYSSSKSIVTRTRKAGFDKDLKRASETVLDMNSKRIKSDLQDHKTKPTNEHKLLVNKSSYKTKPINRKMVRPIPICAFCLGDEALNKRTKRQENMITCWDCGTCAHPTCLQWPDSLFQKVRTIRWQCLQCKRCSYCGMISRKDDDMLLCDACDQGFHIYCCDPPIKTLPKGEWVCRICRPSGCRKEKPSVFSPEDYDFEPDCQIITPETVRKLCNISPKPANSNSMKSVKNKVKMKSKLKPIKVNLLHLKKKKLVNKAVQRQRQALTDGLSKFFTPSNKRQSRVSKQSISSDSLFDKESKKSNSIISPPKDKCSSRSVVSSSRSKSPIMVDVAEESLISHGSQPSVTDKKRKSNKKLAEISCYHSPKRVNHDNDNNKLHNNFKKISKKLNFKKISLPKKIIQNQSIISRGPGRPKKQLPVEQGMSALENSASITESSSITMSKNDLSTNYSVLSTDVCEPDPCPINDIDRQWYADIQQKVAELLPPPVDAAPQLLPPKQIHTPNRNRNEHADPPELSIEIHVPEDNCNSNNNDSLVHQRFPPRIQIGRHVIDTWYSAPYPSEYARLNVLYICEYCLKPIKSYDVYVMHMQKCTFYFPPGNEIYRNGDLSVFEVDGYVSKLYCQQLCLLAKLFLDHKTLYYDVEPFLFYVAVLSKNKSSHIIGYFSKEKRSTHKYNLSCIMVLPPHQKYNYGRFLIDFSYLLSRKEGQCGSPEKPLSTLGRISYESYWKSKILPYILNKDDVTVDFYARQKIYKPSKGLAVTIDRVSTETGISPHDVASTIQLLSKKVDLDNSDRISIQFDWEKLKSEAEKYASRYPKWIPIDQECLRWVPLINPNEKCINIIRSQPQIVSPQKDFSSVPEVDKIKQKKSVVESNKNSNALKSISTSEDNIDKKSSINESKSETSKPLKKKRESITNGKSIPPATKNKSKSSISDKIITNQNKNSKKKEVEKQRDLIVTRNLSHRQSNSSSSNHDEISPIKVDLTKESSENSDIQEADDCLEISSSIPPKRKTDIWTNKKPLFEQFKETVIPPVSGCKLSPPKESPPINRNDPSPVSMVHNEIVGPVLLSPEIDEENEEESDLGPIINDKRRLILILEKCDEKNVSNDSPRRETIDLSDDIVSISEKDCEIVEKQDRNVFLAMENKGIKEMQVVISRDSPTESNPIILSNSEDSLTSTNSEWFSVASKIDEFLLPATVKETTTTTTTTSNSESEKPPPILSRISSQEDCVSNTVDDSSTSFNLPADISQNEEFKNFYNDGNVFNSISNSQTDSSEKDADESLLSVSNSNSFGIVSDLELNGAYSCDSSICYNLRPRLRSLKLEEEFFETSNNINTSNNLNFQCSPGQSDILHNDVSSTTPFVSPAVVLDKMAIADSEVDAVVVVAEAGEEGAGKGGGERGAVGGGILQDDSITFEDINYVNDVDTMSKNDREIDGDYDENCKEMDQGRNVKIEQQQQQQIAKENEEEMNSIHIDIVSSSFNENSAISDSSL